MTSVKLVDGLPIKMFGHEGVYEMRGTDGKRRRLTVDEVRAYFPARGVTADMILTWSAEDEVRVKVDGCDSISLKYEDLAVVPEVDPANTSPALAQNNKPEQALRYNGNKTLHELIDPMVADLMAQVLTHGAKKYARENWRIGMPFSETLGSLKRHINDFELGFDTDEESELPNLAHALVNAMFLLVYSQNPAKYGKFDDRLYKDGGLK